MGKEILVEPSNEAKTQFISVGANVIFWVSHVATSMLRIHTERHYSLTYFEKVRVKSLLHEQYLAVVNF